MSSFNLDERERRKEFAAYFKQLEDRIANLERAGQLSYASIDGGAIDIYDDDGTLKGTVGVQPDGGVALTPDPANTEPPPTPSAPTVEAALAGLVIGWDGRWDDAESVPTDFALVQVHVGHAADFTPNAATQLATIADPTGGTATVHVEGYAPVWVRLVAVNTAALTGTPSVAVQGQPRQAVGQDLIDGIVTETKLAQSAVTQAKIALGAVGSAALADGAVLEEKLAKAAVTVGKIANGAVLINALGGALSDSAAQRYVDTMNDPAAWTVTEKGTGATWTYVSGVSDAPTSQHVGQATGYNRLQGTTTIPYEPGVLYRVSARVRLTGPPGANETFYVGVAGIGADGKTLVNRNGVAGSPNSHYYVAASNQPITTANGWVTVVGFIKDRAAAGSAGPNNDPRSPGVVHNDVRYIAPYVWLNYNGIGASSTSVMQVDCVTLEALKTGIVDSINFTAGAVNAAAIATDAVVAGKIAADAISARELQANSVTASELSAGSVTAAAVAAGAITTDKLTVVGGSNLLSDPSFEGAYSANLVAGNTYFSIDPKGNGSAKSLKVNAAAVSVTTRNLKITTLPILAGDQLFLAFDYLASSDYTPTAAVKLYAKWEDSAGTTLGWGVAQASPPTLGGASWTRVTGTVTAPPNTVQATIWAESFQATAGAVWFDNAAVRPVVAGVMIADGAITAPKILAGAITTDKLVALSVTAEKIASLAITTDKLAALSITADKMAVNSVTATAIQAGVIDSTHIKAGAINADRLSLGTDGNLIADPSFEGAVSVGRASTSTYWSIVGPGNNTPLAMQVNAANGSTITRSMTLATVPGMPGQKLWLSIDYYASTDWNGLRISFYGQWLDASGNILGYSTMTTGDNAAVKGTWTTLAGVPDDAAPAGTTQLRIACSTVNSSAGTVQYDNASARIVLASGFAGARSEISPRGLQLFDDNGEEAVSLMTGRPNYLTLSADGLPVATIDQNGGAYFQSLAVADTLTVDGSDWTTFLNQSPLGIQAINFQTSTRTASATEMGFVELAADIDATRMYRIVFAARANPSASGGELQLRLRDGGTGAPTITSTQRYVSVHPMALGNSFTARMEYNVAGKSLGPGLHRFLLTFTNALGPSGQTCTLYGASDNPGYLYVEDTGPYIPATGGYNDGGGTVAQPPKKYTKTYACTWSGSYANRGSYNSYYGNSCYQGYYSSTNGMQASLIGFPSSLGSDLSGATIVKAELYLYFDHWYNNAGGKAVIKAHSFTSRPSTFSSDAESQTISWARNEGKWVDITAVFDSTKWRGIALDPNNSSTTYYGRARGFGQTNPPQLRVTYTK